MLFGIYKKKIIQRQKTLWNIILLTLTAGISGTCGNLTGQFWNIMHSEEWMNVRNRMILSDSFFGEKSDLILTVVLALFLAVWLFNLVIIFLKIKMNLKNSEKETGIYRILGYSRATTFFLELSGELSDVSCAVIPAGGVSWIFWKCLMNSQQINKLISVCLKYNKYSAGLFFAGILSVYISVLASVIFHYLVSKKSIIDQVKN